MCMMISLDISQHYEWLITTVNKYIPHLQKFPHVKLLFFRISYILCFSYFFMVLCNDFLYL